MTESEKYYDPVALDSGERRNKIVVPTRDWIYEFLRKNIGNHKQIKIQQLGGLVNSNFRLTCADQSFFLRICNNQTTSPTKEISVLNRIGSYIRTPRVLAADRYHGMPVYLYEWIDGSTLKSRFSSLDANSVYSVGIEIGVCIADFYRFGFSGCGFLDAAGKIETPFVMDSVVFSSYILGAISQTSHFFDQFALERIWTFVEANSEVMDDWPMDGCLVHGDFHSDNVLLDSNNQLAAIVDWESAMAWHPVHDIAHLLRRPIRFHSNFEKGLLEGYKENGGWIPPDWNRSLRMLQLLGWIDKLANDERRKSVIRSALSAIEELVVT